MKRVLTIIFDRLCGQPDLLRNSRSLALRELLATPVEVKQQEPMPAAAQRTATEQI